MKITLLLIEWGLMPKSINWASSLYLLLHLGLLLLAGLHYHSRHRAYCAAVKVLATGAEPGALDKLAVALGALRGAQILFVMLLVWEFVGSTLLFFAGRSAGFW